MTIYLRMVIGSLCALMILIFLVARGSAADQPAAANDILQLRINEFMAENNRVLADPQEPGTFPDWVELYNPSAAPVSLDGLFLSDDSTNPLLFPITNGLTIPANGFLIFYADDDPGQGAFHTNFTLSARRGGILTLYYGPTSTLIDNRSFGSQVANISEGYETDGAGSWRTFSQPTPGFSNGRRPPIITQVVHTPTLPLSSAPVDVTALITDDSTALTVTLYYSFTGSAGFTPIPMSLSAGAVPTPTYVAQIPPLPDNTLVLYYVAAQDPQSTPADPLFASPSLAPGKTYNYVVGYQTPALFVNEVMSDNKNVLLNPDRPGRYDDWIELYNAGSTPVVLDGLYLTDDPKKPKVEWYQIPVNAGLTIQPGGYIIFYADSNPALGPLHTNFGLNRGGEEVALYGGPQGVVLIDGFRFGAQAPNRAFGRATNGSSELVDLCPTPNAANQACNNYSYIPHIAKR